jgi:hypothetical protein
MLYNRDTASALLTCSLGGASCIEAKEITEIDLRCQIRHDNWLSESYDQLSFAHEREKPRGSISKMAASSSVERPDKPGSAYSIVFQTSWNYKSLEPSRAEGEDRSLVLVSSNPQSRASLQQPQSSISTYETHLSNNVAMLSRILSYGLILFELQRLALADPKKSATTTNTPSVGLISKALPIHTLN